MESTRPDDEPGDEPRDDEVWDEERWERYLREADARTERWMRTFTAFLGDYPAPARDDAEAYAAWEARLREHLRRQGLPDAFDAYPPGESGADDEDAPDAVPDPLAARAEDYAARVIEWSGTLPDAARDSPLVAFVVASLQVPAELVKARAFETDRDVLGGAIACVKRALAHANAALGALAELREAAVLTGAPYADFYEALYELRNAVALRVLALRERFDLGVD